VKIKKKSDRNSSASKLKRRPLAGLSRHAEKTAAKIFKAERTRKALGGTRAHVKRSPAVMRREENREAIVQLRIAGHSLYDIGQARELSVSRVSEILSEEFAKMRASTEAAAQDLLDLELIRIDQMILSWHKLARVNPRASDVYLSWLDKRHKLLGLNINRTELAVDGGPVEINASRLDLSKLSDEQLGWLEIIMRIAGPQSDESVVAEMPSASIANDSLSTQ
jgi:hypothetical protein